MKKRLKKKQNEFLLGNRNKIKEKYIFLKIIKKETNKIILWEKI